MDSFGSKQRNSTYSTASNETRPTKLHLRMLKFLLRKFPSVLCFFISFPFFFFSGLNFCCCFDASKHITSRHQTENRLHQVEEGVLEEFKKERHIWLSQLQEHKYSVLLTKQFWSILLTINTTGSDQKETSHLNIPFGSVTEYRHKNRKRIRKIKRKTYLSFTDNDKRKDQQSSNSYPDLVSKGRQDFKHWDARILLRTSSVNVQMRKETITL